PATADVVITPLRRDQGCDAVVGMVFDGTTVLTLLAPFDRDEIAHALHHGAFPADWEWDSERILAAAVAALDGDVLIPLDPARALAPGNDTHRQEPSIGEDEAAWLVALSRGATVVRLADDAGYSERAMFRRLADLYTRLGARGRTEALLTAERLGLLDRQP
ncbi:MAG: hypothetical protein KJ698_04620, partial [Actinobacteria bacterium]|nr:hypothetical protein [Actinomycetota bacterium]MBU1492349.1 hypothetical protein [Actinomycetota bacterium]